MKLIYDQCHREAICADDVVAVRRHGIHSGNDWVIEIERTDGSKTIMSSYSSQNGEVFSEHELTVLVEWLADDSDNSVFCCNRYYLARWAKQQAEMRKREEEENA